MGYNDRYRPANIGGTVTPGPSSVIKPAPVNRPAIGEVNSQSPNNPGRGGFDQLRAASLAQAASGEPNGDPAVPGAHNPLTY